MTLKYLLHGCSDGGLGLFNGGKRHRTISFTTNAKRALRYAHYRSQEHKQHPVVVVLREPYNYDPKPRFGFPEWYNINLEKNPVNIKSKDVLLLTEPSLDDILQFLSGP